MNEIKTLDEAELETQNSHNPTFHSSSPSYFQTGDCNIALVQQYLKIFQLLGIPNNETRLCSLYIPAFAKKLRMASECCDKIGIDINEETGMATGHDWHFRPDKPVLVWDMLTRMPEGAARSPLAEIWRAQVPTWMQ